MQDLSFSKNNRMLDARSLRHEFLTFVEDLFSFLGFPRPENEFSDQQALVIELNYEGFQFEILHAAENLKRELVIKCRLKKVIDLNIKNIYPVILHKNLSCIRQGTGYFGIDIQTKELCAIFYSNFYEKKACEVLQSIGETARNFDSSLKECINSLNDAPRSALHFDFLA